MSIPLPKTYLGIDNGVTGAFAALFPDDSWQQAPVCLTECGREKLLDIGGNLEFLNQVAARAGGRDRLVVVCEESPKDPRFGARGNYANGRSGEFWRVLLTLNGFSFAWVSARIWQRDILRGIVGSNTKEMARLFLAQRYPAQTLDEVRNAEKREAIRDAMCVAIWARMFQR